MPQPPTTGAFAKLEFSGLPSDRRHPALAKEIPVHFQVPLSSRENIEPFDIRTRVEAFQQEVEHKFIDFEQKVAQLEARTEYIEMIARTESGRQFMSPAISPSYAQEAQRFSPDRDVTERTQTLEHKSSQIESRLASVVNDHWNMVGANSMRDQTISSLREQIRLIQTSLDDVKASSLPTLEKTVFEDRVTWQSRLRELELRDDLVQKQQAPADGQPLADSPQLQCSDGAPPPSEFCDSQLREPELRDPGHMQQESLENREFSYATDASMPSEATAWMLQFSNLAKTLESTLERTLEKTLEKSVVDKIMSKSTVATAVATENTETPSSAATPMAGQRRSLGEEELDCSDKELKKRGGKMTKIVLHRSGENWQHVGLTVSPLYHQGFLEVEEVWDPSLTSHWNFYNPDYEVSKGDLIKSVNGVSRECEPMIVEMAKATHGEFVELIICRFTHRKDSRETPSSQ